MADFSYDVVVIGGGPVGENAAARAVRCGLTVALVEHERYGGECSYWACMPSKALLRPGHALTAAQRLPGVPIGDRLDPSAVFTRRDAFAAHWDDSGQADWAQSAGIDLVRGRGRITGVREVTVDSGKVLSAKHAVVVCTGSVPTMPDIAGLADVPVWTSRDATSTSEVPERLAVLGAGVVGVEMAQALARLGSQVELIGSGDRPLPRFADFVGAAVATGLRGDGVNVRLESEVEHVWKSGTSVLLRLASGDVVTADRLLVATGRQPAIDGLGLDSIGLVNRSALPVDDSGLVSDVDGEWLYAAGDVTGRAPLTHQGKYAGRIVGDVIGAKANGMPIDRSAWSGYMATADHCAVPQVVFTDPEVASVGRVDARPDRPERTIDLDLAVAGSALHADGYSGKARIVLDTDREVIIGATFVGQDVAELLHAATIAVVGGIPLRRLWHAVPAYPTISEIWLRLLEEYGL